MPTQNFMVDVKNFADKAKANMRAVVIETIGDINEEIVARTPVKTGFLKGSWFPAVNTIPTGKGAIGRDPSADMAAILANFEIGDTFYVGNTAPYARRIEYGFIGQDSLGRNYNQSGRFFVAGVLNNAQNIAQAAASRIASGQSGGTHPGGGGTLPDVGYVG